jgi:hypothetical protein
MNVTRSGTKQFRLLQLFRLALDSRMCRGQKIFCPPAHRMGTNNRARMGVDEQIWHVPAQEKYPVCKKCSPPLGGRVRRGAAVTNALVGVLHLFGLLPIFVPRREGAKLQRVKSTRKSILHAMSQRYANFGHTHHLAVREGKRTSVFVVSQESLFYAKMQDTHVCGNTGFFISLHKEFLFPRCGAIRFNDAAIQPRKLGVFSMKNKTMVLGFVLIVMAVFPACSQQQYNAESDFKAKPVEGGKGVEITEYVGEKFQVRIPPRIQNLSVISIGSGAFMRKDIISVTIPNGADIDSWAFYGCPSLTSVTFQVTISSDSFYEYVFSGDLSEKYLAGGKGTYTRTSDSDTWTKK